MPEHFIPRATLHEDLLRLYREDNEEVALLDPVPDDKDRVHVITRYRGSCFATPPGMSQAEAEARGFV